MNRLRTARSARSPGWASRSSRWRRPPRWRPAAATSAASPRTMARPRSPRPGPSRASSRCRPVRSTSTRARVASTGPAGRWRSSRPRPESTSNYLEDINSNESFFAKLRPELENGESGGRDIIVATDWMAKRYYDLGYAQELDKSALPNVEENLLPSLRNPDFDPERSVHGAVAERADRAGRPHRPRPGHHLGQRPLRPRVQGQGDAARGAARHGAAGDEGRRNRPRTRRPRSSGWRRSTRSRQAVDSGQIRDITGNDYIDDLPRGDIVAAIGWSGDAEQLKLDNPDDRVRDARRGLRDLVRRHDHPGRRARTRAPPTSSWTTSTSPRTRPRSPPTSTTRPRSTACARCSSAGRQGARRTAS